MGAKRPRPLLRSTIEFKKTRAKIILYVWENQRQMRARVGHSTGQAFFVEKTGSSSELHFSKRGCSLESVAHECTHAAIWLERCFPEAHPYHSGEEKLAGWVGELVSEVVSRMQDADLKVW